jgi:crossover junction endodeoxyribonuclease RuvC
MNIVAIDLGTKTGWAIARADGSIVFGTHVCKADGRKEIDGLRYARFRSLLSKLQKNIDSIDQVFFEKVESHSSTYAAQVYGGYKAILEMFCAINEIPCTGIPVGTIKKFTTGKGNADKDQMVEAVKALGFKVKDDNQADAIAILLCSKKVKS